LWYLMQHLHQTVVGSIVMAQRQEQFKWILVLGPLCLSPLAEGKVALMGMRVEPRATVNMSTMVNSMGNPSTRIQRGTCSSTRKEHETTREHRVWVGEEMYGSSVVTGSTASLSSVTMPHLRRLVGQLCRAMQKHHLTA